jgi:hypothetical protein
MPVVFGDEVIVKFPDTDKLIKGKRYYIDLSVPVRQKVIVSGTFEGQGPHFYGLEPTFYNIKVEEGPEILKTVALPKRSEIPFGKGIRFYEIPPLQRAWAWCVPRSPPPQAPNNIQECSICTEPLSSTNSEGAQGAITVLPCKHRFHRACINAWVDQRKTTCPMCRGPLNKVRYGGTRRRKDRRKTRRNNKKNK